MAKSSVLKRLTTFYRSRTEYPVVSVVRMQGMISSSRGPDNFSLESLRKKIDEAFEADRLAAVLVSVNSPGGSPAQCDLITNYLAMKAAHKKVNVTMFVEDVAASGGYWIACAGHEVFATKSSIIGSLGVIFGGLGFTDLIKKIGVERRVLSAGENKALMDPFLPLQDDHVEIVKKMLSSTHQVFIDHVKKNRGNKLTGSDAELFNGAVWTGEPAVQLGLVDGIDTVDDFIVRNFGEKVKVNRPKSKIQEIQEMFGSRYPTSMLDLVQRERAKSIQSTSLFA